MHNQVSTQMAQEPQRVEKARLMCDSISRKLHDGSDAVTPELLAYWENELAIAKEGEGMSEIYGGAYGSK